VYPQAYSHLPQAEFGVQHSTREDLEDSRRRIRQAVDESRETASDRYGEADDGDENDDDDDDEEFEEYEEDEDDELYV